MKLAKIIYVLLALVVIGLMCYQGFVAKNLTGSNLTKGILILVGIVLGWLKLKRRGPVGNKKAVYSKAYAEFIGTAFDDSPKLEKQLYNAIHSFNTSKYTDGIKKLQKLYPQCTHNAQRFTVHVFTALCFDNMGAYSNAIEAYQNALLIRENSTVASNMGICYAGIGNYDRASECYLRAARADGTNPYPLNNLAQLHVKLGEYETALQYAQQALALKQDMAPALNAAATCNAMLDNQEEYERYFRRAVSAGTDGKALKSYIESLKTS